MYILRTAAESRVKSIGVDAERKDQKIDALMKQVRLVLTCGDHRWLEMETTTGMGLVVAVGLSFHGH